MGIICEHWCSKCKKALDKSEDGYAEVDFINMKEKGKHNRAFLCKDCLAATKIGKKLELVRLHSNPNFNVQVKCNSAEKCSTFEAGKGRVSCAHIAVIEDKIYCKRRHPGSVRLPREASKVLEANRKIITSVFGDAMKQAGFPNGLEGMKELLINKLLPAPTLIQADTLFRGTDAVCPDNVVDEKLVRRKAK